MISVVVFSKQTMLKYFAVIRACTANLELVYVSEMRRTDGVFSFRFRGQDLSNSVHESPDELVGWS